MAKGSNFEIKTTLAIDGEKKFKAAMDDASLSMRVMDSEMRRVEAAYQAGGDGAQYYAEKSRILKNEVAQQEAIVEALKNAVDEAGKKYGQAAKETQTYKIKLNQAETSLIKLTKESKKATKEMDELGDETKKVGKEIEEGLGDSVDEAADKLDSGLDKMMSKVNDIRNSMQFNMVMEIGAAVVEGVQAAMDLVNEYVDYNMLLQETRNNVERRGMRWEDVEEIIEQAAGYTGDQEGALQAVSNLVEAGIADAETLEAAMQNIIGVYLASGRAISPEQLAEGLRESVISRTPTGAFAETLEGVLGEVALETVQQAMEGAATDRDAMEIALSYLTENNMRSRTESLNRTAGDLVEYNRTEAELQNEMAELARNLTPMATAANQLGVAAVSRINEILEQRNFIAETLPQVAEAYNQNGGNFWARVFGVEGIANWINNTGNQTQEFVNELNNGVFEERLNQSMLQNWFSNLFPSAGAEELPAEWGEYGQQAYNEFESGFDGAHEAGTSMIQEFNAGITEGSTEVLNNVGSMVNQINGMLGSVTFPSYGYGGMTGGNVSLYVDGQELGRVTANGVSGAISSRVNTIMRMD